MRAYTKTGRSSWLSLVSQGAWVHFVAVIALTTVIPVLAVVCLLHGDFFSGPSRIAGLAFGTTAFAMMVLGYVLLAKYPKTIIGLRRHMQNIARGELPDNVVLPDGGSDIAATAECFNLIIGQMKRRIETTEKQHAALVEAAQQRAMVESLCTACHYVGQPATVVAAYLEILKTEPLSPAGREYLAQCVESMHAIRDVLARLNSIGDYRSEPYFVANTQVPGHTDILLLSSESGSKTAETGG